MKKIEKIFNVENNHGKIIEKITEKLLINSNLQTFFDFTKSNGISGYNFFCKKSKIKISKYILFYKDVDLEILLKNYDRIEISQKVI